MLKTVQTSARRAVHRLVGGRERLHGFPWDPNPYHPAVLALRVTVRLAPHRRTKAQKALVRRLYENLNVSSSPDDVGFMNYGYAPPDHQAVDGDDQANRMGVQLYAKVAAPVDLTGLDVLEVGCGPGGGSSYLHRTGRPRSLTGVDFATRAVEIASRRHGEPGLNFVAADAEQLPFPSGSFDAVVNVESSHCYPNPGTFFAEVARVLRPGGRFVFADIRAKADVGALRQELAATGMVMEEDERITPGVVHALRLDSDRRRQIVEEHFPRPLQSMAASFCGVEGGEVFEQLRTGELEYLRLALRKA